MNINRITVRYAKALLETAVEKGIASSVNNDMKIIAEISTDSNFKFFLQNPTIQISKKNPVISEIFKNKVNPLTLDFLFLLTKNKREIYLPGIARNFMSMYRQLYNIKHVEITSTAKSETKFLSEIKNIIAKIIKSEVELTEKTDTSILGGFIINIDDTRYDASIKHKLEKIQRELLSSN